MQEFQDRLALVTGAASGIGRATAQLLEESGATVIGFDLQGNEAANIRSVDLTDETALRAAFADIVAGYDGTLDLLVNCAGVHSLAPYLDLDLATFDATMQINLRANLVLSKLAIPAMVAQGRGAIVNIGSTFGLMARGARLAYGVSKAAIVHMTQTMAIDLADSGVRVNCVCPGIIKTPMTDYLFKEGSQALLADAGIETLILDMHMSVMEGSISAIPRRLMVCDADADWARRVLKEAGEGGASR